MNDKDLKEIVNPRDIPDLDDASRERIVTAAVRGYRQAEQVPSKTSGNLFGNLLAPAFKPIFAVAAGIAIVIAVQYGRLPDSNTDRYNAAVFKEYRSLFKHELRAVVARNGDVDVVLGGQEEEQTNPIIFLRIETDGEPVFITAYSGQTIEAEIGGKTVTMDILTTSDQGILVAADDFMLESGVLHGPNNLSVNAHMLETSL